MKNWSYSIQILVLYIITFCLWMVSELPAYVLMVTALALIVGGMLTVAYSRKGYFRSTVEWMMYVVVFLDIAAEGWYIAKPSLGRNHPGAGFLLCTLAFALVLGLYRCYLLHVRRKGMTAGHV